MTDMSEAGPEPGDKLFDPILRKERDAFPGEVVRPEKQKALQRFMETGRAEFGALLDRVKDKLTEDEVSAVLKAGDLYAELRREEYLEAVSTNPANIIQQALLKYRTDPGVDRVLVKLDEGVALYNKQVREGQTAARLKGNQTYGTTFYLQDSYVTLTNSYDPGRFATNLIDGFGVLRDLGFVPDGGIEDLTSLASVIKRVGVAGDSTASDCPTFQESENIVIINALPSSKPGLEGVRARIVLTKNRDAISAFSIVANKEARAIIVDKGQYSPYQKT